MKTLYVMRHGEKDTSNPEMDDYDVQLTSKGIEDTKNVAEQLKEKNILPDLIVSSPSCRTRETAELIKPIIKYRKNIMYNEVIYMAFLNELVESITYTFDNVDKMMIIGHNPALTALCLTLGGFKEKLGMGEVLVIEFDCSSWTAIEGSMGKIVEHVKPKL